MARERQFNIAKVAEQAEQTLRPASPLPHSEEKYAEPSSVESQEIPTKFRGRKKVVRTISKTNGKTLYFEESTNKLLREVAWNSQVDMQDIVRVAVNDFLSAYSATDGLNEEGRKKILEYVKSTSRIIE